VTPRLVHITTSDISLELLLGPELRAFRDAGYDVHTASQTGPYVAGLEAGGIVHHALAHSTRAMAPTHDVRAISEVRRLLVELRPDIVHTHNPKSGIFGRLGAKWARVPVIINTVHGLYAQPQDRFAKRAVVYGLERLASTCSDVELVVSPEDVEVLRRLRIPADKIELPGNGVDLDRFSPERPRADAIRREVRAELGFGPDDVVCGAVGRLVVEKGFRELIDAAERLRSSHPRVRIAIVGPEDRSKPDALTPADLARATDAGIVLTGSRSDMDRLYLAMDLFVLASWREGFPRAAMEAVASGLPVITTDVRGCRLVVERDVTGRLVPVRDPASLARAIGGLVEDGGERSRMGEAALAKARAEFDERKVIERILAVYERELRRAGRPLPTSIATDAP
jgi:glycosyltransferase involved in cell wall biosynthesis